GAAVVVLEAVEVLGLLGALVDRVVVAVAVDVADGRDRLVAAAIGAGEVARAAGVVLGRLGVLLAAVVLAAGQRVLGELDVRLGDRGLLGRTIERLRAVADGALERGLGALDLAEQLLAHARGHQGQRQDEGNDEGQRRARGRQAPRAVRSCAHRPPPTLPPTSSVPLASPALASPGGAASAGAGAASAGAGAASAGAGAASSPTDSFMRPDSRRSAFCLASSASCLARSP